MDKLNKEFGKIRETKLVLSLIHFDSKTLILKHACNELISMLFFATNDQKHYEITRRRETPLTSNLRLTPVQISQDPSTSTQNPKKNPTIPPPIPIQSPSKKHTVPAPLPQDQEDKSHTSQTRDRETERELGQRVVVNKIPHSVLRVVR